MTMARRFDSYAQALHAWLGIPPDEQPADHYRLLGIRRFESDPVVIENAADQRMAHLRRLSAGPNAELAQKILNEVAAAKVCLLNAAKKRLYDEGLRGLETPLANPRPALHPHEPLPVPVAAPVADDSRLDVGDLDLEYVPDYHLASPVPRRGHHMSRRLPSRGTITRRYRRNVGEERLALFVALLSFGALVVFVALFIRGNNNGRPDLPPEVERSVRASAEASLSKRGLRNIVEMTVDVLGAPSGPGEGFLLSVCGRAENTNIQLIPFRCEFLYVPGGELLESRSIEIGGDDI